jgi:hypothetical protein
MTKPIEQTSEVSTSTAEKLIRLVPAVLLIGVGLYIGIGDDRSSWGPHDPKYETVMTLGFIWVFFIALTCLALLPRLVDGQSPFGRRWALRNIVALGLQALLIAASLLYIDQLTTNKIQIGTGLVVIGVGIAILIIASPDRPTIFTVLIDPPKREWQKAKTIHVTLATLTIGIGLLINALADPSSSSGSADAGGITAMFGSIWMFLVIADHLWPRPGQPSLLENFIWQIFFCLW